MPVGSLDVEAKLWCWLGPYWLQNSV